MQLIKNTYCPYPTPSLASALQWIAFIALLWTINPSQAQDLEKISEQKIIKISGGISANTTFYNAWGIDNRRDPFYWMLSANLNLNILGIIQAPFSVTISQQNKSFSQPQPFNRFGLSPKYKAVTAHLGHRSMHFSEYSLAGNMFLGVGVEVTPENSFVRVSAMYGRLAKAVEKSAQEGLVFAQPTFRRIGYGAKIGLGRDKHIVDLILFRAKDDENSIPITDEVEVMPEDNLVAAIHSTHTISEKIAVELEYAYSLFTRDKRAVKAASDQYTFINNLGGLYKPNISSEFHNAFTISTNYNGESYQANIKYRQVDPGYRTLGSSFLNNGMKDLTAGLSWGMLERKLTVSTNGGVQQSTKENAVLRVIYGVNMNYSASDRLSLSGNYANFSTTTRQTQIQTDILVDSLQYFQVTRSGGFNANYRLGSTDSPKTLFLSANIQDATDSQNNSSTFYNLNAGQQMKIAGDWQFSLSGSYNKNYSELFENTSIGPVAGVNRTFLEGKIRSSFSAAWLNAYLGNQLQSQVLNIRWSNSLRVAKKHAFAVNIYYLNNNELGEDPRKFSEFRGMVNYNYSFL